MTALLSTNLGSIPLLGRGKVRDLYAIDDALLLVATDRISAFDHVLGSGIPGKGKILTQISLFWFDLLSDIVPNHLITANVEEFPAALRSMRTNLKAVPCSCGAQKCFLSNALRADIWPVLVGRSISLNETVCGIRCRPACRMDRGCLSRSLRPRPRAKDGAHDENISFATTEKMLGSESPESYGFDTGDLSQAVPHAERCGLILADTKFEFGITGKGIILADEVLTPDSSRFWEASAWKPGGAQPSFDKQFVRDYLESIHWNKQAPAPGLPDDVVDRTLAKYLEAFRRLTGRDLMLS